MTAISAKDSSGTRELALQAASSLFYREGVRAVGMDWIVKASGIAKTTIYRHFPTKDLLVEAFLEREDEEFWNEWDGVADAGRSEPRNSLMKLCDWIGARVERDTYRGCPQINVAAEFAQPDHPARKVAFRHKSEMVRRLTALCREIDAPRAPILAQQIGLLFDGAFMSSGRLQSLDAAHLLRDAVERLLAR